MTNKICTKCNTDKPLTDFSKKSKTKDGYDYKCKDCHALYLKKHYLENKEYYKSKARQSAKEIRPKNLQFVIDYLKEHPCIDCEESDPIVLEFDHIDPQTKYKGISNLVSHGNTIELIKAEIAKCEVRCANCHRRKTAKQFDWYKNVII